MIDPTQQRRALRAGGFAPIPVFGKKPAPQRWQEYDTVSDEMIEMWAKTWPDADNTGILTKRTPAIDIDIVIPAAAEAVETLAREHFGERGRILVRFGSPPRRAILLRTDQPFKIIKLRLDKDKNKIEVLATGQQLVAFGIHPDTRKPYRWFGGEPGEVKAEELPTVTVADMVAFLADAKKLLAAEFGFAGARGGEARAGDGKPGDPQASIERVTAALQAIPNDEVDWHWWTKIGMAVWAATGGSHEGFKAFDDWSSRCPAYDQRLTEERWAGITRSPPNKLGAGTLIHHATLAGWVPPPLSEAERRMWFTAGYFICRFRPSVAWRLFVSWCERHAISAAMAWQIFKTILEKEFAR
jgi:hypothetical protein